MIEVDEIPLPDGLPEPYRSRYMEVAAKMAAKLKEITAAAGLPEEEIEELIESCDQADAANPSGPEPRTELQVLLQQCHDLKQQLVEILRH
jgi:hypothetical protein